MEEGKCPRCKDTTLDYGAMEICDTQIYYPWTCKNCGAKGKEWYNLEFTTQTLSEEEK